MGFAEKEEMRKRKSVVSSLISSENPKEEQVTIETLEDGKYLPDEKNEKEFESKDLKPAEKSLDLKDEKKGKKKKKKPVNGTLYSFVSNDEDMENLKKISVMKQCSSVSEYIREIINKDCKKNKELIDKYNEIF